MNIQQWGDQSMVSLSYEEEIDLATKVMDFMAMKSIWGDFQTLLERIYFAKCRNGSWINADDFITFLDFVSRYNLETPDITMDGKNIKDDLDRSLFNTNTDRNEETRRMIILAWREVWEHHDRVKSTADMFKTFPESRTRAEDNKYTNEFIDEQTQIEDNFWKEVEKIITEFDGKCSQHDAYVMASDYMPRGDFSTS